MVRIQDDLFEAVNAEWLAKTEIPSDRPRIAAFDELVISNEQTLMHDFATIHEFDEPVMTEFAKFYKKAGDFIERFEFGTEPVKPELEKISAILDFETLTSKFADLILNSQVPVPFGLSVDTDMKDAVHYAMTFSGAGLILPDTTYYADEHPRKAELLDFYRTNTVEILREFGFSAEAAQQQVENTVKFDAILAQYVNTSEEWAKYAELYNPVVISDFTSHIKSVPFAQIIEALIGKLPEKIVVYEKRFYENFDQIVNVANFELIKSWMLVKLLRGSTQYLSDDMRILGSDFSRKVSGTSEARSQEKHAFDLATGQFSQAVGLYYGHKYFGEAAKADVQRMTSEMIKVYQERLDKNTWLSRATIDKAIKKLDAMTVFIGFPDKLPEIYQQFTVSHDSLYSNIARFDVARSHKHYDKFNEDVDKTEWHMPAHMVNAYFSPDSNTIVFPAAILQKPFYSATEQTPSQNYGGIGAVIAHEISHAFDNNGALFDEFGNMNNWWTDQDFKAFEAKQELMIAEFDGLEIAGGKVNGKLVVSENIADAGGLTAAMTAALREPDADLKAFFTQWGEIWRLKASEEYQQMLLSMDVHAPGKLRANVQASNLDEFFATFDIQEGDGMWRAEAERVKIW
ncbi:M13 family metallopeptidase [Lactococcus raffinolactis]|jgi:putative endopeptidase|uniref:endopeptidase PepO n=1 Tax=Pseudolactococcus raffinolactis TaxID=1366 RepID=UPI001C70632D|nr:M13-type metalloendopeptidase [Lactococcus raffinolactis]MBW9331721.1 peptidase M13 [Lactococcus raffinolactis]MDG4961421.1 peptidase M13 [Lactococcus raffinolactis]